MAGRIHQVQNIGLAILRRIFEAHGLGLDRDPALTLNIHGIEHLLDHVAGSERSRRLDQPIGKGRLAVVDMGDDGEIADVVDWMRCHGREIAGWGQFSKARAELCGGAWPYAASGPPFSSLSALACS